MKQIETLGIPCYNRGDLLLRCILSIDHRVGTLFVINNGDDPGVAGVVSRIEGRAIENAGLFGAIRVERHKNLGCGPSWNRIIRTSPGWWLFLGNDIQLLPGSLAKLAETVEANPDAATVFGLHYAAFALTELAVKEIGHFDENFYPAYFEDCDHWHRLKLAGAKIIEMTDFACIHGEAPWWGSSTIKSDPVVEAKNGVTFANLQRYYVKKWGGGPREEVFTKPFDRDVPLDYWEFDEELRRNNSLW